MGDTVEPTQDGGYVFWEPPHYSPEEIEAVRPDGVRVRPVMQLEGRRLGFEEPLPEGTQILRQDTLMWVVPSADK